VNWTVTRLKHLCVDAGQYGLNVSANDYVSSGYRLIRISDIDEAGHLRSLDGAVFVDVGLDRRHELQAGDILLARSGATVGRAMPIRELGEPSTYAGYLVRFRPLPSTEPRFLAYVTVSRGFQEAIQSDAVTSTIQNFNAERYANIPVVVPPFDEQRHIADFLDAETSQIDALSRIYEATRSTISERIQCLIDMCIDDAGDPVPLKYFVRFREGPGIMAVDFRDQGTPLIRISGLQDGVVTLNGANYLDDDMVATRWPQFRLRLEDYVISGSATMGAVSVVRDPSVVGAIPYTGLIILRPIDSEVVMKYVAIALTSNQFTHQIDLLKAGATMQHFGPTHLSQVSLPFPDRARQIAIATAVHEAREQSSKVTTTIDRQLTLLAERRQALITAAVTGKIDVTTARGAAV
jgi:type I restriction enzyme, S subunit